MAGALSIPSAVFAEASWYGSLRGGIAVGGDQDARFGDVSSRWGVKGSNELSDGLTAVYRFEHHFSTENAALARSGNINSVSAGRLAHVGLSGGFGNITLGQIWSASFNATGAVTDNSMIWGNSGTSYRVGNALSYSNSVGNATLQIDAIMDGSRDTGDAVDQVEFGMTIGLGDIGKLAVAYIDSKATNMNTLVHVPAVEAKAAVPAGPDTPEMYYVIQDDEDDMSISAERIMVWVLPDYANMTDGALDDTGIGEILLASGRYHIGATTAADCTTLADDETADNECVQAIAYVVRTQTEDAPVQTGDPASTTVTPTAITQTYYAGGNDAGEVGTIEAQTGTPAQEAMPYVPATTMAMKDITPGYKGTHIAVEFGIGGVTAYLGHSKTENDGGGIMKTSANSTVANDNVDSATGGVIDATLVSPASELKITHAGVRGSIADGGLNYVFQYQSVDNAGAKSNPFILHLNKSLGDGATAVIEHANNDDGKSGQTWVGLKVDF